LDRPNGAAVRRRLAYPRPRLAYPRPRFVLVGEAAGYAGCRFSGIPFTCEAQLVGPERLGWTLGLGLDNDLARSSTAETPWVERSARTVWEALEERTGASASLWREWRHFDNGRRTWYTILASVGVTAGGDVSAPCSFMPRFVALSFCASKGAILCP